MTSVTLRVFLCIATIFLPFAAAASEKPKVERTLKVMREKYGYIDDSAKEAISFVLRVVRERE